MNNTHATLDPNFRACNHDPLAGDHAQAFTSQFDEGVAMVNTVISAVQVVTSTEDPAKVKI